MPAALAQSIDWAGIRAAAVVIGVKEAARQASRDLPPQEQDRFVERVAKRAVREQWLSHARTASSSSLAPSTGMAKSGPALPLSTHVHSGSDAIAKSIAENSEASRVAILKTVRKGSEHLQEKSGPYIVKNAKNVQQLASAGNVAGKWNDQGGADRRVMINIGILNE